MRLLWRERSNPLAWLWAVLTLASSGNIALLFLLYRQFQVQPTGSPDSAPDIELMLFLCAAYVFGCAFRSFLPRADVQRICLFDTWLSSVVIGRSKDCDIRLADPNASRRHAEVRQEGTAYWLLDLDSTNGVTVNGKRVDRARLAPEDDILIGTTEVHFERGY